MDETYRPAVYWEQRLSQGLGVATVGYLGLGAVYNRWLYRARFDAMRKALAQLHIDVVGRAVLEAGVGSGAWLYFWKKLGIARFLGIDITSTSTKMLKHRYPQFDFIQANICHGLPIAPAEKFDIVTAFDVLFHVVDDDEFAHAIAHLADLVDENGWVILSDGFCTEPLGPFYHEYHRSNDHYLRELGKAGLRCVHIEPIFYTMMPPIGPANSFLARCIACFVRISFRVIRKLSTYQRFEWMNAIIGGFLYSIDRCICRGLKTGPSLKLLFARKEPSS